MPSTSRLALACAALLFSTAVACRSPQPAAEAAEPVYKPTATIKELMLSVIDPSADAVWNSVTLEITTDGVVDTRPQSEEDWTRVRNGAVTLMEAANLLMLPGRRMAPPGDKSVTPGIELEPEEMDALVAKDRPSWNRRATALHDVVASVVTAIDKKDADKVFELGEQIEATCEGCHKQYWYPNEVIPTFPSQPR